MERKWETLTCNVLSLGKSIEYKTILRYLKAYLSLVRWFMTHVKTPPKRAGRADDSLCFHYDCTDQEVQTKETTRYMGQLVDFFQSLIPSIPIRQLNKFCSDHERLNFLFQQQRAELVQDLPKIELIEDPDVSRQLVISPDVSLQICC